LGGTSDVAGLEGLRSPLIHWMVVKERLALQGRKGKKTLSIASRTSLYEMGGVAPNEKESSR